MNDSGIFLPLIVVFFGIFIVLVAGLVVVVKVKQANKRKDRSASFQELARKMNFNFLGEVPYANLSGAENFNLFTSGEESKRFFVNTMTGAAGGFQVSVFDFVYYVANPNWKTNGSKTSSAYFHHLQTVVMLESPQINLPRVAAPPPAPSGLQTEGFGSRLIFYRSGIEVEPSQIGSTLNEALQSANSFLNQYIAR